MIIIDPKQQDFKDNYKLMIGAIIPRPIALVSSISSDGILNLAPFSFFSGVCSNPPTIMFAPARRGYDAQLKDTVNNIRDTEEFVINTVPEEIAEKMEKCATNFPPETDEFDISGLTPVPSKIVTVPRVSESPINFECKLNQIIEVGDGSPGSGVVVLGTIIMYHIKDDLYDDGRIDQKRLNLIGRLGGNNYTRINDIFTISRQSTPPK